ncbi:terminase TerL endonuclease subunit, partial [Oenococcus oeni]
MKEFNLVGVKDIKAAVKSERRRFKRYVDKYQDYATRYAFDVLFTDDYETGRDEQLACFRHLQDLGRQKTADFPYEYNLDYVNAIEYFARNIPDPTDMEVLITPFEFESFCLDSLIGWRNVKTKGTRFHIGYISFARQQGKTWIAAILINFYYFVVGWNATAQDFLIASYDNDHAGKLFDYVSLQAKVICKLSDFKAGAKERDVDVQARQVIGHNNRSTIRMGSSQAGGFDSKHNLIAVYDEFGNMKPKYNESINQIISGQNFPNALFVAISTAYPDVKVRFKKDQDSIRQLIEQDSKREGDETFMVIYKQDSEEEVYKPETWEKSNPLLRSPKLHDKWLEHLISLRDEQERAGDLASFANKTMNLWSKKFQDSFLSLENIQKNIVDSFNIRNREVYVGFDASQSNDNTSFGFEYPYVDQAKKHIFHFEQFSFIPFAQAKSIKSKEKQDGLSYRELEKQGFCQITDNPHGIID